MRRAIFVLAFSSVMLASCGAFQEGESGTTPIGEAITTAGQTFNDVREAAKDIPIPGVPTELVGIIAAAVAAVASGVTVLVRRSGEKKRKAKANAVGQQETAKTQ